MFFMLNSTEHEILTAHKMLKKCFSFKLPEILFKIYKKIIDECS